MTCIDSDVLIDFLRNDFVTVSFLESLKTRTLDDGELKITSVNSYEVLRGFSRHTQHPKYVRAMQFLSTFDVLEFDFQSSQKAAEIFEQLRLQGHMIDEGDILIAAICISRDESLLTRNTKHFERVPGLKLEPFSVK